MPEPISAAVGTALLKASSIKAGEIAVKETVDAFLTAAKKAVPSITDRIAASMLLGFKSYTEKTYLKCREYKTLLNYNEPVSIETNYTNIKLSSMGTIFDDYEIASIDFLNDKRRLVITGLAGSGKSIFMKYLTISVLYNFPSYIPVYIELRSLNETGESDFISHIMNVCSLSGSKVNKNQFELAMKAGNIIFILDGYDEINFEIRDNVQKSILNLEKNFPNSVVIVSGRPDDTFRSWTSFYLLAIQPLEKNQCIDLITNFKYDEELKANFLAEVESGLYERHRSFLSSPLLTTIMMITYRYIANIPEKVHEFYSNAFDALFEKHDFSKEGVYKRVRKTDLSRQEFKQCFSYFCAQSYLEANYNFNYDNLLLLLDKALFNFSKIQSDRAVVKSDEFAFDLKESVCLLQVDGLDWTFVHRSFQEYFSAVFAATLPQDKYYKFMLRAYARSFDTMSQMCHEINKLKFESEWLIPALNQIIMPTLLTTGISTYASYIDDLSLMRKDGIVVLNGFHSAGNNFSFLFIYSPTFDGDNIRTVMNSYFMGSYLSDFISSDKFKDVVSKYYKGTPLHDFIQEDAGDDEDSHFSLRVMDYPEVLNSADIEQHYSIFEVRMKKYLSNIQASAGAKSQSIEDIFD